MGMKELVSCSAFVSGTYQLMANCTEASPSLKGRSIHGCIQPCSAPAAAGSVWNRQKAGSQPQGTGEWPLNASTLLTGGYTGFLLSLQLHNGCNTANMQCNY